VENGKVRKMNGKIEGNPNFWNKENMEWEEKKVAQKKGGGNIMPSQKKQKERGRRKKKKRDVEKDWPVKPKFGKKTQAIGESP